MDFNQSLERLFSVEPTNILQQMFQLNSVIQNAKEEEVIAVWHTLQSAEAMLIETNESGKRQISVLKNSVKSRLKAIAFHGYVAEGNKKQKLDYFETIVGSLDK